MARPARPPDPLERRRIVEATSELMGEVGPASTKLSEIATRAGVAYGTIYRHFADRNALLFEALLDQTGHVVAEWEQVDAIADPIERIIAICATPFETAIRVPGLRSAFSGAASIEGAQAEVLRLFDLGQVRLVTAIEQPKAVGFFGVVPTDVLARMLLGGMTGYLTLGDNVAAQDWRHVERGIEDIVRRLAGSGTT